MATNVYTSSYTLDSIRRRGLLPVAGKLRGEDLLAFVNDVVLDDIAPSLISARENYYLVHEDQTLTDDTEYPMPSRANAEHLDRIVVVNADGQEQPLDRVETGRKELGQCGYELLDNTISLVNPPRGFSTLRVKYFRDPNRLVDEDECAKISDIDRNTGVITVDAVPETFSTSEPLDFIAGTPGFRWRSIDVTPTAAGTTTVTFDTADIPDSLAVGDYIALAGETPIVQVPKSIRSVAEQAALCLALDALGDSKLDQAEKRLERMRKSSGMLTQRVKNSPRVVLNRYSPASMRRLPAAIRRWW